MRHKLLTALAALALVIAGAAASPISPSSADPDPPTEVLNVGFAACKADYTSTVLANQRLTAREWDAFAIVAHERLLEGPAIMGQLSRTFTERHFWHPPANGPAVKNFSDGALVRRMYRQIVDRNPSPVEEAFYVNRLNQPGQNPFSIVDYFLDWDDPQNACHMARVTGSYAPRVYGQP